MNTQLKHAARGVKTAKFGEFRDEMIGTALFLLYTLAVLFGFVDTIYFNAESVEEPVGNVVTGVAIEPEYLVNVTENARKPEIVKPATIEVTYFNVPLDEDLQDHIFKLCESYGVDPSVVVAMIWKESTYRVDTIGDSGASRGLMQIQQRWHQKRMDRLGVTDLMDPYQNVTVGIDLFAGLMNADAGVEWALMAYNGGASYAHQMRAAGKVSYYVSAVLAKAAELRGDTYSVVKAVE